LRVNQNWSFLVVIVSDVCREHLVDYYIISFL
jgi:hypothetical protein